MYRPSAYDSEGSLTHAGTISHHLEAEGPTGIRYKQTNNRAELRAVIGALQFRDWSRVCNGGWRSIVIATDSEYVARGITGCAKRWEAEDWTTFDRTSKRYTDVKNQDLWKLLLYMIRQLQSQGLSLSFWRIPREWNERADEYAGKATQWDEVLKFQIVHPVDSTKVEITPWRFIS